MAMKGFSSTARLWVLALCVSGTITGCKKADAPVFSPLPGIYTETQYVSMTSASLAATIVYTTDGSAPGCIKQHGTIYSAPVAVTAGLVPQPVLEPQPVPVPPETPTVSRLEGDRVRPPAAMETPSRLEPPALPDTATADEPGEAAERAAETKPA